MEQVPQSENPQPSTSPSPDFDAIIKKYHQPQSKKWLLGIFFVVIVLGVIGYFWYQDYQKAQSQIQEIINYALYTFPTPTPNPTTNWKTYINQNHKYSLRLPEEIKITTGSLYISFNLPAKDGWASGFTITHWDNPDNLSAKEFYEKRRQEAIKEGEGRDLPPFDIPTKAKEITIDGIKAFQFVTFAFDGNMLHTYVANENIVVDIFYYSENPNDPNIEEHVKLFNQILSTFKFLDQDKSSSDCCSEGELNAGYRCVADCGPPVMREGDVVTYSCLGPDEQKNRPCPICLSQGTKIATPNGEINVEDIQVGQLVWTVDKNGKKVVAHVVRVSSTFAPKNHQVVHLVLKDGRELLVSPNHPITNGKTVGNLQAGESYDGSTVSKTQLIPYQNQKTYDILLAGQTGFYFANGILMASSLRN